MSRLEGGIFSRPRGKTGGVVFGAGRTREGKIVTSRLLVKPSNPDTTEQRAYRSRFASSIGIVRGLGPEVYKRDWNRAVGQLPGFQSLMSIIINEMATSLILSAPPTTNLGTLPNIIVTPGSFARDGDELTFAWTANTGTAGSADDVVSFMLIQANQPAAPAKRYVGSDIANKRSDLLGAIDKIPGAGNYVLGIWTRGADANKNLGMLSICNWFAFTVA